MSALPRVSIVTPSFNQAAFLEQTLLSVLTQDYPHLEYWVIDGGSSDGSLELIQKYESRLTGWVSEKDQGQADAINKGFERSTGEIIAWLNSDDLYRPGAISSAVEAFQRFPEVGMVFSDVDSIDADGEIFNRMRYGDWGLQDFMTFHIIGQPGVFMRRSVLERAGYLDLNYQYLLDHHLWLRIGLISGIKYIKGQPWAAARIHSAAKNVAQAQEFGKEAYRLADWMISNSQYQLYTQNNKKKIWAGAHRLNAFYLVDAGKYRAALRAYWLVLLKYPPYILTHWRRVLYALFSPLGLEGVKSRYLTSKKNRLQKR